MYEEPILIQGFPIYMDENEGILKSYDYIEEFISHFRRKLIKSNNMVKCANIYVSDGYLDWQKNVIKHVKNNYDYKNNTLDMNKFKNSLDGDLLNRKIRDTMSFANHIANEFKQSVNNTFSFDLPFSEKEILLLNKEYIEKSLKVDNINIFVDKYKSQPLKPFLVLK